MRIRRRNGFILVPLRMPILVPVLVPAATVLGGAVDGMMRGRSSLAEMVGAAHRDAQPTQDSPSRNLGDTQPP